MGYFKRRISRSRCAERVDSAIARQAQAGLAAWTRAPDVPPANGRRTVFLRFAVGQIDSDSHQSLGVFQAAYELRDEQGRESDAWRMLGPAMKWYGENLTSPGDVPDRAIFWFKSDAGMCVRRIWEVICVLSAHDRIVWMMRCEAPGRIVYEDTNQVAAVPHRTRAWRSRPV